ncbi:MULTISPECIES: hypothetical protein [unclassified Streptomyces]|uniref:hypothetical protein n=1 Tax=unclassified Streptomyces TaxID=2593676 RepID=UPI002DDB586D|nr:MULTISPECIES: hypothetical protein [unclassified Streptomyces]WSA97690.1 hypothetical protein OIE63_40000 [Streptomyces sp. NBC_01795]WSB82059.1 hypothetical protein OHB04_40810 [Streptomyces sp. NBC_01775]WSS46792.1 hypothetical protein OG220_40215 [Streptomyces sp. NBC_01187]WSS46991.1 hypothetical protein OG220_41410 [Streptomyces sp. NBC_01187]
MTEGPQFAAWGTVSAQFWIPEQLPYLSPVVRLHAPAGPVLPDAGPPEGTGQPPPPPEEYRERVDAITATFAPPHDRRRLAWAAVQAENLDQEATATYGQAHTHTISIREMRGWIAGLQGEPEVATHWDLHVVRLQATVWGIRHPVTLAGARRAVQHWMEIADPAARLALSKQLLSMLTEVTGDASSVSRHVRKLVRKAEAAVTPVPL